MDQFWDRMIEMFGHKFISIHGDETNPDSDWFTALHGLTQAMIDKGFSDLIDKGSEWPPSIPEFKAMCSYSGEDYGLPSEADAFSQAINWGNTRRGDKLPCILYALGQLSDSYQFHRMADYKAEKMFKPAWDKTIEFVMENGMEALPNIPLEIKLEKTFTKKEKAQNHLKALKELVK